ncbi:DUF4926 domain-containing protein [Armatimonas rosea]|uniref:DUF4926 domain-containing protein n=1 Tax=Armatimonas rosea TaxID=685828 RepID=A0A7W9W873_ARMRO|nr:DUF4926 domain-containing protein [Armatimonas rosea]MBB6053209.1 hypothetical protein [Armatimonas rosea]
MDTLKLFDVVALLKDRPEEGLVRGQVGAIVDEDAPGIFDVEFSDTGENLRNGDCSCG